MDYNLQFTLDIRHINGVDNVPEDALSRGINSFLLEPLIDIPTFSKEQQKDEHPQRLLREKKSALQLVQISSPQQYRKDHLQHKLGQVTSVRTYVFMQSHFYRGA